MSGRTETPNFKDHFSARADAYTRYRPTYPPALFSWLAGLVDRRELAWDCGCGNGQAALGLAPHFERVIGTDPSEQQIANAVPHERIRYAVTAAEKSGLDPASVDLVVVAQALHWFDFPRFYAEVRRVVRPGGVLAAITYGEVRVAGEADAVVSRFYHETIGPYWPPERRHVDEGYRSIPFLFPEIAAPPFAMEGEWTLKHLLGYLGTWSAVKEYERTTGADPLAAVASELAAAWGDPQRPLRVSWPLALRVGRL